MDSNSPAIERENFSAVEAAPSANEINLRLRAASILLLFSGLLLICWASLNGKFRSDENTLNATICLPLAIGSALILTGSFVTTKLKNFGFWLSLALVGQAASLQMIDAGRLIHFQHYRTLPDLLDQNLLSLILIAFQIVFVTVGIGKRSSALKNWLGKNIKIWKIVSMALFLVLAGAAVTPEISVYATSLVFAAVLQFVNLTNIVLAAWAVPDAALVWLKQKIEKFSGATGAEKPRLERFPVLAAVWVLLLAGALSYFVYQAHPHVPDETQYLFQANYLATGQLSVKAPPVPEAFAMYMVPHSEARWFGIFPPGWSALLAIGVKLNIAWLVNPLLAGICVILAYLFFQRLYTKNFARLATLFLCCSPWFVFMAMSLMSHVATLASALSAAVLLQHGLKKQRTVYVFAAGLFIGILSLIRPLDGVAVAVSLGVWTLFGFPNWKTKLRNAVALIIGTVAASALIFPYNRAVTGNAMLSPSDAYYTKYFWSGVMAFGFGENRGFGWGLDAFPGHSPLEAVINAALNTFLLNTELFGWAAGSLVLAVIFLFSGNVRKKDLWALAVIGIIVGGYSLFWYHGGPDFGARYWFLAIIPLVALTVRGVEWLGRKINKNDVESEINSRVVFAAVMLCVLSLLNYFPWRALDKYYRYLEMQPGISQLAREKNFGKSLVLIRGEEHPDYQSAWVYNPLDFEGDAPVYAHDKTPEIRARLLTVFKDRPVWIVDGPTRAGGSYKIVLGPVNASEIAAEKNQ